MKPVLLKEGEMVVKQNDFGLLVESYVNRLLRYNPYVAEGEYGTDARLRAWWPQLEEYYQRHIQNAIEVAIEMDKYPPPAHSDRKLLQNKELWIKFLADFRPLRLHTRLITLAASAKPKESNSGGSIKRSRITSSYCAPRAPHLVSK